MFSPAGAVHWWGVPSLIQGVMRAWPLLVQVDSAMRSVIALSSVMASKLLAKEIREDLAQLAGAPQRQELTLILL